MLMVLLALGATAVFFQDTLRGAWRAYAMQMEEEAEETVDVPAPVTPQVSTAPEDLASADTFDPTLKPEPPPGNGTPLEPAMTARAVDMPAALVEVPAVAEPMPMETTLPAEPAIPRIFESATPETQPAVVALKLFFKAETWQERSQHVQWQEQMKPLMERYYASNPDEPLLVTHIQLIPKQEDKDSKSPPHCVFQVAGGGLKQPLPVMVELQEDGWKVDWLTFIEFKDDLLKQFLEDYVETPARFHVLIRRTHYFEQDTPELDRKICFEVQPPMPGFSGYVFAQKGTPLAQELDRNLGWDVAIAPVVVELQWRKENTYQWVELKALPQYNWRTPEPAMAAALPVDEPVPAGVRKSAP